MRYQKCKAVLLIVVFLFSLLLFIPSALAENYKIADIYEKRVSIYDTLLNAGDKISGGSGVTIKLSFFDANGNLLGTSNGSIKSFTINGKKCTEWRVTNSSSAAMAIGSTLRGSFAFGLKPAYAVADTEGYFLISEDTYSAYVNNEKSMKKKVKFTGQVFEIDDKVAYVSIAKDAVVAITADVTVDTSLTVNGRISCKGDIREYIAHNNQMIPVIACYEITEQQYEPLKRGDAGEAVVAMKERMQELGYYSANAELSIYYSDPHIERVKLFQKRNGLPQTGLADIETLTLLYSDGAIANN